jgi:Beta-propeller repeat
MKIRGSVVKFTVVSAVALLACSFLLVAGLHLNRNSSRRVATRSSAVVAHDASSAISNADRSKFLDAYGRLPLSFVENQGQTAQEVRYVSHGGQYDLFLTSQEAVLALRKSKRFDLSPHHRSLSLKALREARKAPSTDTAIRMQLEGANPNPQIAGVEPLPGKVNYFIGNDPKKWHADVPKFAQVKYGQIYPGVDLIFYGNQRKLEYDFIVAPGADPNVIRMNLSGAKKLRRNSQGDILVSVSGGDVQLAKPVVYQTVNGQRQVISGNYALRGNHVSFVVGQYDRREPLIVDPILNYSTYLGGGSDDNAGYGLAVDASGDVFVGGSTVSTDFPVKNGLTAVGNAAGMGFVTELNPTGTAEVYSTYLGGTGGGDTVFGVAISGGDVYATGFTFSTDFPTSGTVAAFKPTVATNDNGTSFLTKLNPGNSGAASLIYSTYLGGNDGTSGGGDFGNAVAADTTGNAYVTGIVYSPAGNTPTTFPVVGGFQTTLPSSAGSAFLSKINTTVAGTPGLVYSTYLGGDGANAATAALGFGDEGFGIAIDTAGKAYITGTTTSSDFPVSTLHFQSGLKAANTWSAAFVSEIDTTKTGSASLIYSTYLGGSGIGGGVNLGDFGTGIDLQSGTTVAYVTGTTNSADFPTTTGAYQTTGDATNGAAYVTLLDTAVGNALKYSTFLGGNSTTGYSVKVETATGNALVAGATSAINFPTTPGAYQSTLAASATGDGFVSEISPGGKGKADLLYSTYIGGTGTPFPDQAFGVAFNTLPTIYVAGVTFSTNLPSTSGVLQPSLAGTSDAFVAQLNLTGTTLSLSVSTLSFTSPAIGTPTASQTVTLTNSTNSAIPFTSATITAPTPPAAATDFAVTNGCGTSIPALATCTVSIIFTPTAVSETGTLTLTDGDASSPQTVALTGAVVAVPPDFTISASPSTLPVPKGSTGMSTITVGSIGTFNSAVALTCTGAPTNSTCSISPSSVTPAAGGTTTAALSFVTQSLVVPPPADSPRFPPAALRVVVPVFLALLAILFFVSDPRLRTRLAMASAVLLFVILAGCGSSSSGTTKGTYTLTVTGTSGAITHTAMISATVN